MTVPERVREYIIGRTPEAVCDDCIADSLGLSVRQHANQKTRALSREPSFGRRKGICVSCDRTKEVIRHT